MGQPTVTGVHVDQILTNMSVAYMQDFKNFIAGRAFGTIPVKKKSDKYYKYAKDAFLRSEMKLRAPATESAGSGYGVTTDNYACEVYALHKDVSDQERANYDTPLDADQDAVDFLTYQALLNREAQWIAAFFATGKWQTDITPGVLWSTLATSDPLVDVNTGRKTILQNTGREPNVLVLGYEVYNILREHPDFVDRIKYTSSEAVTVDIMARLFDVDKVFVAKSIQATSEEGAAVTTGFMHGKHALLAYADPNPGIKKLSAGAVLQWTGVSEGLGEGVAVSRFRMDHLKSDRLEIEQAYTCKVVASDCGYFFNGAVA